MAKPYLPIVSADKITHFRPSDEATWTASPLVNAVLTAIYESKAISGAQIAEFMCIDVRKLSAAVELETGLKLHEVLHRYKLVQIHDYIESHPKATQEEIATANGYASYNTLWRFFQRRQGITPSGAESHSKSEARWQAMIRDVKKRLK